MLKKEEVTIYGGAQTRDFIYVEDVIRTIYRAIQEVLNKNQFDHFNVLTGRSVSINHLFKILSDSLNYSISPILEDYIIGDPKKSSGSIKKLINKLGVYLETFTSLEDGLLRTIQSVSNKEK